MYTPGMTVMSLLLKNRYECKRSRDFFETEIALAFALLLYSTCLNDIEHECEFRKYDCLMHVGMGVLIAF